MSSRSANAHRARANCARVSRASLRRSGATALLALAVGPGRAAAQVAACAPVSLRDALERLAASAGVRLSYSRELLDIDRAVCSPAAGTPILVALDALLRGTGVGAVSVGGGQIVLAPVAHAPGDASVAAARPTTLDRVVVTGSPSGAPSRALPIALSVVDGAALGPRASTSFATALDGVVPGLWIWSEPTTTLLTRYAGLRGASSFSVTTPKLYIDGVEVANPLFVTALAPDQVERVEVIRGPQGAALYGADAISGVINIVTRHDGADGGRAFTLRTGVGAAATAFASRPALAQDYGVAFRTGAESRSAGLSVGLTTLGPVVPGSTAYQLSALADTRRVGRSGVLTLTARFVDAAAPPTDTSPIPGALGIGVARDSGLATQRLSQLTLAATGVRTTGGRWTQTVTAGLDAYRVSALSTIGLSPITARQDSAQGTTRGGAARGTLRASSTATYDPARDVAVTVTGIADYSVLRDATQSGATLIYARGGTPTASSSFPRFDAGDALLTPVTWLGSAGLVAQSTIAWRDAYFLTVGARGERNDGFTVASHTALLPSIGLSAVRDLGGATVKLRSAYGSGTRPARSAARAVSYRSYGGRVLPSALAPEAQTGIEGGVDLFVGGGAVRAVSDVGAGTSLAVHVTGFDQRASGLIQQVAVAPWDAGRTGRTPSDNQAWGLEQRPALPSDFDGDGRYPDQVHGFEYALQNVGAIRNRGFEGEAQLRAPRARAGALVLGTTLAYVDSRVTRTASGYTGELRVGDRALEVPRWTLGATASWRAAAWSTSLGVARAVDWVNYDRVALATALATSTPGMSLVGPSLRAYWRTYTGVTRVRANFTHELSRGLSAVLTGENLLNQQEGEPDNLTKLPGRTLTAGFRARF